MKGILAPLSTHEEAALRKVGFGSDDELAPAHVRRLLNLQLIGRAGDTWQLTPIGRQRYGTLVIDTGRPAAE